MKAIKVTKDGETVGILPNFDEKDTLSNLRDEIFEDLGLSNFAYLLQDTPIDFSEESALKVEAVAQQINLDNNCLSVELTSSELYLSKTTDVNTSFNPTVFSSFSGSTEQHLNQQPEPTSAINMSKPAIAASMFLHRPTSWELRGVKIYTAEEVEMAKGMEKKRRLYWNEMAKNLCNKTKKSKQDILRLIDEAWRKEQTGLLLKRN